MPGAEQIEAEPALAVDDRRGHPLVGRGIKLLRRCRQKIELGEDGVETEDDQDDDAA